MGWMGFGNFNDAGNLFAVNSPISCYLLLRPIAKICDPICVNETVTPVLDLGVTAIWIPVNSARMTEKHGRSARPSRIDWPSGTAKGTLVLPGQVPLTHRSILHLSLDFELVVAGLSIILIGFIVLP